MPRGPPMISTEEAEQTVRTNIHASHSPAMSSSAFGNRTEDTGPLATDYFPSLVHSGTQPCRSMESTTLTPKKVHGVRRYARSWVRPLVLMRT